MIEVIQVPAFTDNYIYVLHDPMTGLTGAVDPGAAEPVQKLLTERGWKLDFILVTHHHSDHVGGILALKERYGCKVHGSAKDRARIPGLDREWSDGDTFLLGNERVVVLGADGHTRGHIIYWLPESRAVFVGDTIFSIGCGKLFEGTAAEMWASIDRLRKLPAETLVYCAHEYTEENGAFAVLVEPENFALTMRMEEVRRLRAKKIPTVPTKIGDELAFNPFLRPESEAIQKNVDCSGDKMWMIFAETRTAKDRFDQTGKY